jgi:hypothetical protein
MPNSSLVPDSVLETVLEATLKELGGERLDGSGFEQERPVDLDSELTEGEDR